MAMLSSILGIFNDQPLRPPTVRTDRIVPIHSEDDIPRHRGTSLNIFMRFDDALDIKKLEQSLLLLLDRPGWNKLGGRLRLNARGSLECHIPALFDAQRPPVIFSHQPYAISIVEHPLASRLPKAAKGKPQIIENTTDFLALMHRPGGPESLQDYLQSDLPALGVHVLTFTDATLITLTCSHLLIDFVGIKSLFDAWSLVLQGRESELPPVHDIDTCPMETLGNDQKEPYEHVGKLLSPLKMGILGLRLVWNMIWQWMAGEEEPELRLICVPGPYLKSLRNAALLQLAAHKSEDGSAPFVSEGDVLLAWWTQHLAPHVSTSSKQTISIIIIFELRALLMAKGLLTSGSAYLGNAHSYVPVFVPTGDVLTGSLGDIASALRQALITLGTKEQVEAFVSLRHTMSEDRFVLGDAGMTVVVGTNGTKAKIYDVDFSMALVNEGPHMGGQEVGRPSLVYSHNFEPRQNSLVKTLYITGKDANGDYWLYTRLKKGVWDQINQAICNEALITDKK